MEKYINKETIIEDNTYNSFKEQIACKICECIMLEPVMCVNCQNHYCKKCIEGLKKRRESCPGECEKSIYKNVIGENRLIAKMKFKCIKGCGVEILFKDIKKHYSTNCLENKKDNNIKKNDNINKNKNKDKVEKKSNIKMISKDEVLELKNNCKNDKSQYFTSNYISFFIFYFIL